MYKNGFLAFSSFVLSNIWMKLHTYKEDLRLRLAKDKYSSYYSYWVICLHISGKWTLDYMEYADNFWYMQIISEIYGYLMWPRTATPVVPVLESSAYGVLVKYFFFFFFFFFCFCFFVFFTSCTLYYISSIGWHYGHAEFGVSYTTYIWPKLHRYIAELSLIRFTYILGQRNIVFLTELRPFSVYFWGYVFQVTTNCLRCFYPIYIIATARQCINCICLLRKWWKRYIVILIAKTFELRRGKLSISLFGVCFIQRSMIRKIS